MNENRQWALKGGKHKEISFDDDEEEKLQAEFVKRQNRF